MLHSASILIHSHEEYCCKYKMLLYNWIYRLKKLRHTEGQNILQCIWLRWQGHSGSYTHICQETHTFQCLERSPSRSVLSFTNNNLRLAEAWGRGPCISSTRVKRTEVCLREWGRESGLFYTMFLWDINNLLLRLLCHFLTRVP